MLLNTTTLVLFVVSLLLRRDQLDEGDSTVAAVVVSAVALGILSVSGWLGGKLTYQYGVRVAREADQDEGYRASRS